MRKLIYTLVAFLSIGSLSLVEASSSEEEFHSSDIEGGASGNVEELARGNLGGSSRDKEKARLNDDSGDEQEMVSLVGEASSKAAENLHLPADLRRPATEFYQLWQAKKKQIEQQSELGKQAVEFIGDVIEKDGIGTEPQESDFSEIVFNCGRNQASSSSTSSASASVTQEKWQEFMKTTGSVFGVPEMLNNPFANYFEGVITYVCYNYANKKLNLLSKRDRKRYRRVAKLFNAASQSHYLRATKFMLSQKLAYVLNIKEEELEARVQMLQDPLSLISNYTKDYPFYRGTQSAEIDQLENLLNLVLPDTSKYKTLYYTWVDDLNTHLLDSRRAATIWYQILSNLTLTATNACVSLASSAANLYVWQTQDNSVTAILGFIQGGFGLSSLTINGILTPSIANFFKSLRSCLFKTESTFFKRVHLLPHRISESNTYDSARLVILYALLYNIDEVKKGIDSDSKRSKDYLIKLRDFILSYEYRPTESLARIVHDEDRENFKY